MNAPSSAPCGLPPRVHGAESGGAFSPTECRWMPDGTVALGAVAEQQDP